MRFLRLLSCRIPARRVAITAATAAAVAPLALTATPAAAAPRTGSPVVSPTPGQDLRRHRVTIVVRAGDETGDLSVRLNGRQIARDFARGRRGRRVAHVTVSHGLRHGRNVLRVSARRGYRTSRATVRFTVTRRAPLVGAGRDRIVTVGRHARLTGHVRGRPGGKRAGRISWRVVSAPRGSRLRGTVMRPVGRTRTRTRSVRGPKASAAQTPPGARDAPSARDAPGARDAPAARDAPTARDAPAARDGPTPRDGPAARDGPTPRDGPAARDAPTARGAPAARDTPAARDAPAVDPLQPLLKPDVPGTYTVQVRVGDVVDTVQYSAVPADPLVPIDMQVAPAGSATGEPQPGLKVAGTTYRMAYLGFENGRGLFDSTGPCCSRGQFFAQWQVVALDRTTLEPRWNRTYGWCQVPNGTNVDTWRYCRSPDNPQPGQPYEPMLVDARSEIMREAPGDGVPGALILGRTLGRDSYAGHPDDFDALLGSVGFTGGDPLPTIDQPTSFVGVAGMRRGEADVSSRADGELPGYLTADQNYQFHFLSSVRPQFDTRSTAECDDRTCNIAQTVGSQQATATVPRGRGGYLLSSWDPVTGALRGSTFATIDRDDAASQAETQRMLTFLQGRQAEGAIVAITTMRTPGMPANSTLTGGPSATWNAVVELVASFGGTKDGFLRTVTDASAEYTMVGFAGAGEDGGNEAAGTFGRARLRGALSPIGESQLRPVNVSSIGPPAERINQLMLRPTSTAWRYPDASSGPGAAIQCIGAALGKGVDIRAEYVELLTQAQATALQNSVRSLTIANLAAVPGTGLACRPTPADFSAAQGQLVTELGWVSNVRGYLTELSTPEAAQGGAVWGQALTLGQQLQAALAEEDAEKELTADALGFVATLLDLLVPGIGTAVEEAEDVTNAVTAAAGTFWLASEGVARAADGGPDIDPNVRAIDLAAHLQTKAQAATRAFTQIGDVLISDPTKLEEVGRWAGCTPNVPGGCPPGLEEYAATGAEIADLTNVSVRAMGRTLYETLVTQTYPTWDLGVTQFPNAVYDNLWCTGTLSPFRVVPPSAYTSGLDSAGYGAPTMSRVFLMVRSGETWGWAPQAVTDRMFGATGDTWDRGGLGMDPLTVMRGSANRFQPSGTYSCAFDK